jgi:hypothetical protein
VEEPNLGIDVEAYIICSKCKSPFSVSCDGSEGDSFELNDKEMWALVKRHNSEEIKTLRKEYREMPKQDKAELRAKDGVRSEKEFIADKLDLWHVGVSFFACPNCHHYVLLFFTSF